MQRTEIRNPDPAACRYTSLAWAAVCGCEEVFEYLLLNGHDDEELSKVGINPVLNPNGVSGQRLTLLFSGFREEYHPLSTSCSQERDSNISQSTGAR